MNWDLETIGLVARIFFLLIGLILLVIAFNKFRKTSYFDKAVERFDGMLMEKDNKSLWSSRRFTVVFPIVLSNMVVWGALFFIIIINAKIPEVPETIIYLYATANGIASTVATLFRKYDKAGSEQK